MGFSLTLMQVGWRFWILAVNWLQAATNSDMRQNPIWLASRCFTECTAPGAAGALTDSHNHILIALQNGTAQNFAG